VLLVRLDGIGDALVCAPLVAALRDAGHELGAVFSTRNRSSPAIWSSPDPASVEPTTNGVQQNESLMQGDEPQFSLYALNSTPPPRTLECLF
jgi:hypothetical protein